MNKQRRNLISCKSRSRSWAPIHYPVKASCDLLLPYISGEVNFYTFLRILKSLKLDGHVWVRNPWRSPGFCLHPSQPGHCQKKKTVHGLYQGELLYMLRWCYITLDSSTAASQSSDCTQKNCGCLNIGFYECFLLYLSMFRCIFQPFELGDEIKLIRSAVTNWWPASLKKFMIQSHEMSIKPFSAD